MPHEMPEALRNARAPATRKRPATSIDQRNGDSGGSSGKRLKVSGTRCGKENAPAMTEPRPCDRSVEVVDLT